MHEQIKNLGEAWSTCLLAGFMISVVLVIGMCWCQSYLQERKEKTLKDYKETIMIQQRELTRLHKQLEESRPHE